MDNEELSTIVEELQTAIGDLTKRVSDLENTGLNADPNINPDIAANLKSFINANVVFPSTIAGRSHKSSAQTIGDSAAKVIWEVNDYASGITWDSTNNRFSILTAGKYAISAGLLYGNPVDGSFYAVEIFVNGSEVSVNNSHAASAGVAVSTLIFDTQNLSVGDYVEIHTQHTTGADRDISSNALASFFNIAKIN